MSKLRKSPQYLAIIARVLKDYDGVIEAGVLACTSLTNALLLGSGGEESLFLNHQGPLALPTITTSSTEAQERGAHPVSPVLTAYAALHASFQALVTWFTSLQDATFSLQSAVDGTSTPLDVLPQALREKCFELLGELRVMYALECSVRGGILSGLLPGGCHEGWAHLNPGGTSSPLVPLTPALQGNRDALTLAVAAWAVSAHADKFRVKATLSALEMVVGQ